MPIKVVEGSMNVLDAAITRVRNVFKNDCKIYLSFSSGKDSLCMASIVYDLICAGEIDGTKLTVTFIDEEGLYPSMVEAAHRWRRNFLSAGAKFLWFCLPFKQVSVIDHLSSSESWITWEPGKEDVWMRKPPDFAIMYSPYLHYPGEMNYQTFCGKAFADGIQLVGLRTAESLTRLKCIANAKMERIVRGGKFYPIYDWRDSDVWLYIKQRDLEFPEIYMRLYEAGVRKNALRLCAFFGDCSTQGLRWVAETDADLWDRIQKREPNAYLVLLYWDSEMFRRSTKKRRDLEAGTEKKDYKALCKDILFLHPEKYTIAKDTKAHLDMWRGMFIKTYGIAMDKHYKTMYEGLLYGDPKMRVLRILWTEIYNDHNMMIKEAQRGKQH
jgi:predicted phosphoadenosine phosphosulfate sulfurtransferase